MTDNLDLINRLHQVSLDQFHKALDKLQKTSLRDYAIVTAFLMTMNPEPKFAANNKKGKMQGDGDTR